MAGQALTTIGVVFGWGIGTETTPPTKFKEIEECTAISGVDTDTESIDVTPLKANKRKYAPGYASVSETVDTSFNFTDVFEAQWEEMRTAYAGKSATQRMWFCAYHPAMTKMDVYIVAPGIIPKTAYEVGSALQVTIKNTIVDLPNRITAVAPEANTTGNGVSGS